MRLGTLTSIGLSLTLTLPAVAQPTFASPWVGLRQAELDGQPGVILTLGDDNGQLAGGVVFNVVSGDGGQPHVIGHDAHALMNPRIEGDTLHFQVIRRGDRRKLEITARMTAEGKATFHCENCGGDALAVEITRER